MIVEFHCPKCGKALQAADKYCGMRVQSRACKTTLMVPGIPAVYEAKGEPDDLNSEPSDRAAEQDFSHLPALDDSFKKPGDLGGGPAPAQDTSYGIASLYLATLAFLLFFTPALLAGMTGALGVSVAFFAGIFASVGCLLFCRHGYRLAQKAEELPGGQGYAAAGKIVNQFFIKFYALAIVFFLVAAIITLVYAKRYTNQLQEQFKGLDQLKGLEKLLGQ